MCGLAGNVVTYFYVTAREPKGEHAQTFVVCFHRHGIRPYTFQPTEPSATVRCKLLGVTILTPVSKEQTVILHV